MPRQQTFWELNLPLYRSKFVFCGECAVRRPLEELHPIAKAGSQHFEKAIFDLSDFDTVDVEPGYFTSLDCDEAVKADDRIGTREKLHKLRPGFLYPVVRNAPRIDYAQLVAEVAARHPQTSQPTLNQIIKEQLGYRHSSVSPSHLALVRLDDDAVGSVLTCWNYDIQMAVGREHLVRAVEHAVAFGGDILVSRYRVAVRDAEVPFETRTHRRTRPTPPRPVSFRRGSAFVAAQHVPD